MLSCSEVRGKKYSPKGRPGSTPNKGPICQKIFCQIDVKIVVQPFDPPESCVPRIEEKDRQTQLLCYVSLIRACNKVL